MTTQRVILIGSALVILVFSGLVHGLWTDRWSEQLDLSAAAEALEKLPRDIGSWHGADLTMEKNPRSGLVGTLARTYTHTTTGKMVTLFLACGRPGPVATHTPDVCYGSIGFESESPRRFQLPSGSAEAPPEFWTARFVKERNDGQVQLRIYWGWLAGGRWQAAENPRLAFAGEHVLHKMYVLRELGAHEAPGEREPCVEFIHDLLPVVQRAVETDAK